ncbi:hypothetical protein GEMRC1_003290 [Eukaryota sp. GEM-RC1]
MTSQPVSVSVSALEKATAKTSESIDKLQGSVQDHTDSLLLNTRNHLQLLDDICTSFETETSSSLASMSQLIDNVNKINSEMGRVSAVADKLLVLNSIVDELETATNQIISVQKSTPE